MGTDPGVGADNDDATYTLVRCCVLASSSLLTATAKIELSCSSGAARNSEPQIRTARVAVVCAPACRYPPSIAVSHRVSSSRHDHVCGPQVTPIATKHNSGDGHRAQGRNADGTCGVPSGGVPGSGGSASDDQQNELRHWTCLHNTARRAPLVTAVWLSVSFAQRMFLVVHVRLKARPTRASSQSCWCWGAWSRS